MLPASCAALQCTALGSAQMADGTHSWAVHAVDSAGNVRQTPVRTFTVDATPPTGLAVAAPHTGQRIGAARPRLSWSRPLDAGSGVARYEVTIDGSGAASVQGESFTSTDALGDGPHTWSVVAVDGAGNRTPPAVGAFTVDTTAPAMSIAPLPKVLTGRALTVDASGSVDPASGRIVQYEFDLDGDESFEHSGTEPKARLVMATPGSRTVRVRGTDEVGNRAQGEVRAEAEAEQSASGPELTTVTINDGAFATNRLDVTLDIRPPARAGVTQMLISNDGPPAADARPIPITGPVDDLKWRLADGDGAKTSRLVYVFFLNAVSRQVAAAPPDVIVFDPAPPVVGAKVTGRGERRRLRVRVRDRASGVSRVDVSVRGRRIVRRRPRDTRGTELVAKLRVEHRGRITIRAYDRAGNVTTRIR